VLAPIVATTLWLGLAPAAQLTTFEADVVAARAAVVAAAPVAVAEPPAVAEGGAR
jgi:hypothetical protein